MRPTKEVSIEVVKILDSLTALSVDLECDKSIPDDNLFLPANKTRMACAALKDAVAALKRILEISVESGGGPVPVVVADRLDDADQKGCA